MNRNLASAQRELERHGIRDHWVAQGKHLKLKFKFRGRTHTLVMARTVKDCRADANNLALIRRWVRETEGSRP